MTISSKAERISIDLESGERFTFDDFNELVAWIDREHEFWSWLQQAATQNGGHLNNLWKQLNQHLAKIKSLADQYRKSTDEAQRQRSRSQLDTTISALLSGNFWIPSSDPRAQYVKALSEKDLGTAGFCFLSFVQPDNVQANHLPALKGLFHGLFFENALPDEAAISQKNALQEVRAGWDEFSGHSKREYESFRSDFEDLQLKATDQHEKQAEDFSSELTKATETLDAIASTYDEKLALQQPVKYWSDRDRRHRNLSIGYATAFIFGALLVIGCVAGLATILIPELLNPELLVSPDGNVRDVAYWRFAVIAILGGFFIWPVRLLSRILLSNIHLWTDAEERVAMVNTYLSLLRSEAGLEANDRRLILETLFRSAATGIVKDDGLGVGVTAAWSRVLSGR